MDRLNAPCLKNTCAFASNDRTKAMPEQRNWAVKKRLKIAEIRCHHSLDAAERRFPQSVRPPCWMQGNHID